MTLNGKIEGSAYQLEYKEFCLSFIEAIDKRFGEIYNLSEFIFFDLNFLKNNAEKSSIVEEAQKAIPKLLSQLNMNEDIKIICDEYPYIVDIIKQTALESDDINDIYGELIAYYRNTFPSTLKLITMYRILPLTNVESERTFSKQNRIKTKIRSSMEDDLLAALLKFNITFDYMQKENQDFIKRSIQRWSVEKERYFFDNKIPVDN